MGDFCLLFNMYESRLVDSQENDEYCCHELSDFKAKMTQS